MDKIDKRAAYQETNGIRFAQLLFILYGLNGSRGRSRGKGDM